MSRFLNARATPWIMDLLLFGGFLALYARTAAPTAYLWDSPELAAGAWTLGIVHATGYPLYLLLAKGFMLLVPVGDAGYRANLFSGVCAALALPILRRAIVWAIPAPWCAFGAVALLGVSYPIWASAVAAEVYTLHIVFQALMLWLGLRWRATGARRDFLLGALVVGLSFGNHMSTALAVPAILLFAWTTARRQRLPLKTWAQALALSALGPLTYLYLPIRYAAHPAVDWMRSSGVEFSMPATIFWTMRGRVFSLYMFAYPLRYVPGEVLTFARQLWDSFLGVGLVAAAIGLVVQARRDGVLAGTLGLMALTHAVFFVNYSAADKDTMFVPVYVVLAFWVAEALNAGAQWLGPKGMGWRGAWLPAALTAAIIGGLGWSTYQRVNLSGYDEPRRFAERVLREAPRDAVVFGSWMNMSPLLYLQAVENPRPDVELFDWGSYALAYEDARIARGASRTQARREVWEQIRQRIDGYMVAGRVVVALEKVEGLTEWFTLEPRGDLYTVCEPGGCR